jgi:hypothetical protein
MRRIIVALTAATLIGGPAMAVAQDASSRILAPQLAGRLTGEATSFAAPVPDQAARFVAVLHYPGVQLLVISAIYQAPELLRELIMKGDYRQVYFDLNAAGDTTGRLFIEDLGADGLAADREANSPFDITWRDGVERTMYNGEWKEQGLSTEEYRARFEKDEAQYVELLQILISAHAAQTSTPGEPGNH